MKRFSRYLAICAAVIAALTAIAQDASAQTEANRSSSSSSAITRRRADDKDKDATRGASVTDRMQQRFDASSGVSDADKAWMRVIYRQLDLDRAPNAPLYYPVDIVDGEENLFRIMMRLLMEDRIPAYEYLDGREAFTDQYKVKVGEMLDRFDIMYQTQGNGDRAVYTIEEADVPTGQVLKYYIIEKWEFDRRSSRMKTYVEAICPVLTRTGDYGGQANYPMFWVKFDQLRPYLAQQYVFLSDDNNLPQYSLDDYFNLGMYKGEIYKTKNLRNLSMAQMFPEDDGLKRAQDSIDSRLRQFGKDLFVPTRDEYLAMREMEEEAAAAREKALAAGDSIPERTMVSLDDNSAPKAKTSARKGRKKSSSAKKPSTPKVSKPKSSPSSSSNSSAEKSVRRRKR